MFPCQTRRAQLLFALVLVALASGAEAQSKERGLPPIQSFEPAAYEGTLQVFDASQGPEGRMHFVAPRDFAVLHHDGEHWEHTAVPVSPLSVDVDPRGRLWIGSSREVGYLDPHAGFVSVGGELAGEDSALFAFQDTCWTPNGVFFLSEGLLVRWDGAQATTWDRPAGVFFADIACVAGTTYVLDSEAVLARVVGDELVGEDGLGADLEPGVLYSDGQELWTAFLRQEGALVVRSDRGIEHVVEAARAPELFAGPTALTDVLVTAEGAVAVASVRGLLLLDAEGEVQAWLDDDRGLESSFIYSLEPDREGGVWVCQANGVSRVDPSAPVSLFDANTGLPDGPLALARHRGELFGATHEGLYRLSVAADRAHFEVVEALPLQPAYSLLSTPHGMLVATEIGLYVYEDGQALPLDAEPQLSLASAGPDGDRVLLAGYDELRVLRWQPARGWETVASAPATWSSDLVLTDAAGFWIHSLDRELRRVPFDGEEFGEVVFIEGSWRGMAATREGVLVWDDRGVHELTPERLEPVPAAALAKLPWETLHEGMLDVELVVAPDDRVWLLEGRCMKRLGGDLEQGVDPTPDFVWYSPRGLESCLFDPEDPSIAWVGTYRGLLRLDAAAKERPARAQPSIVALGEGDVPLTEDTVLPPRSGARFTFAAPTFGAIPVEYSHRIHGLDQRWSPWSRSAEKEYVRLPGGRYAFEVRARTGGTVLGEARREFTVQTPWFARLPVMIGYVMVLAAIVLGFGRWRTARVESENRRLEGMVLEQTRELRASKESVLQRTIELEAANQRLQRAIRARNEADRARTRLNERLEASERFQSLGAVAGGIAHDFNNYLTSMRGYAELALLDPSLEGPTAEYLASITTISAQAAELCSSLLSLAGRKPLKKIPLDLSEVVRGMEKLLHTSMVDRGELRFDLADRLPPVDADLASVQRSVVNLVVNASEAVRSPHGWVTVRTGLKNLTAGELQRMHTDGEPAPGTYVFVEVSDNGHGLPPGDEKRVFDPYFTTKFVGRGLGLATVFGIVSSHGGVIDLLSTVGRGASFRLLFPRSQRTAEETSSAPLPEAPGERLAGRILVVDDDAIVRGMSVRLCSLLGLESVSAESGAEALERVRSDEDPFDVVLLDLSMPGMNGQAVLAALRRDHPELPVVLMSGYTDQLRVDKLDPATTFLAKPFSREDLRGALAHVLGARNGDAASSDPPA